MTALVQMNTRIDSTLKERGDAVFASIGYTPTSVVRSVWAFANNHADNPSVVKCALEKMAGSADESSAVRKARRAKMDELDDLRQALCIPLDIDPQSIGSSTYDEISNRNLRGLSLAARSEKHGA